jgi:hypothetical protein
MSELSPFVFGLPTARVLTTGKAPRVIAELAEVEISISTEIKALESVKCIASGHVITGRKITGKAKQLAVQPWFEAQKIGGVHSVGHLVTVESEALTIGASPTFTATVEGSATFTRPLEVKTADGELLVPVTGTPEAGEYSVVAGVYTFASQLTGVTASYVKSVAATGETVTLSNTNQGEATAYALIGESTTEGVTMHVEISSLVFTKGGLSMSKDNQTSPETEFTVQAPAGVNPLVITMG